MIYPTIYCTINDHHNFYMYARQVLVADVVVDESVIPRDVLASAAVKSGLLGREVSALPLLLAAGCCCWLLAAAVVISLSIKPRYTSLTIRPSGEPHP